MSGPWWPARKEDEMIKFTKTAQGHNKGKLIAIKDRVAYVRTQNGHYISIPATSILES